MRDTFIPDANDRKVYYLRNQNGGAVAGFHCARIQQGMDLVVFSGLLLELLCLWSRKV